jgi:hypothetical protein
VVLVGGVVSPDEDILVGTTGLTTKLGACFAREFLKVNNHTSAINAVNFAD